MAQELRKVNDIESLMTYFSENLGWAIDPDDYYDIDDITYDFEAEDLGLKEEAFAKITSLKQLRPLVDDQRWGIFFVNFESSRFEVSALRKILSGLVPARRNADHAVWDKKDLLFLCTWGERNKTTIGAAYFEDAERGLPQIKMISCEPAIEDFTQIRVFEDRLSKLAWPNDPSDTIAWHDDWASAFTTRYRQTIQDAHTLTVRLAEEAQNIRDRILTTLEIETSNGYVHLLFEKFRDTLVHDMTEQQFADMYAQTVVYGLFSARCMDNTQDDFCATEAVECIPNTNPFLKGLLQECLGSNNAKSKLSFDELEVGNIVDLLLHTKTDSIITDFNRQTGGGREDPVIHFYEEFLSEYDKTQRVQRGVYYTPQPVVNFIVRAVDDILRREFGVDDGLASTATKKIKYLRESKKRTDGYYRSMVEDEKIVPAIQILDPATGTGTFLRQTILQIYDNFCLSRKGMPQSQIQSEWNEYVPEHLLPRLNGFELMMAPYAVAHMKLAMVLKDTGYQFDSDERLQVYLTNTLEKPGNSEAQLTLWEDPLAFESVSANAVKKNSGINIVLGNPPYSGISSNSGEWITSMIEDYKYINGVHFGERKHWLQDDYVKFIRFGENFIDKSGHGILAFINNHAFIDNPTFRCMRWHLLNTFDEIYIIDLHGNVMKKEIAPNGDKDENVFDIQQGVSINLFVKNGNRSKSLARVYHTGLFGKRSDKYDILNSLALDKISWTALEPNEPFYFFIPRDERNRDSYEKGFSIQELMPEHTTGVVTARDGLVIAKSPQELMNRIKIFTDPGNTDDEVRTHFFGNKKSGKYLPGDSRGWSLSLARKKIQNFVHEDKIQKIAYRPFDTQYIYYAPEMVDWGRDKLMYHLLAGDNYALVVPRQAATDNWSHVQVTKYMADNRVHYSNKGIPIECPLYLYAPGFDGHLTRRPNMSANIVNRLATSIGMRFVPEKTDENNTICPIDVLDYIYAVLFSEKYRKAYLDFLKFDFPRIPYPQSSDYFWTMVEYGKQLRELHLSEDDKFDTLYTYQGNSECIVDRPFFKNNTVSFNKNGDSIKNVPERIWNMYFGGYQPLQKWLKDRKGDTLTQVEIQHFQSIITTLVATEKLMQQIDEIIVF
ncbi:MAG: DNA methyltransferase [Lachnospiraceae bacterium]|nr:DNA methyltransferase [Lachnospiraceae bacterium]